MKTYQSQFHHQWQHLHDKHVRALAWLITSPSLLTEVPPWRGKIAEIEASDDHGLITWLTELDRHPETLHQVLESHHQRRLGRYAENLLAFYLQHLNILYAKNVQVQNGKHTLGEFDFLLNDVNGLLHWELATKFYIHVAGGDGIDSGVHLHDYLGPNLVDTLSAKLNKVFTQQLQLSHNPAAASVLPLPVLKAQALIKGWLFYRPDDAFSSVASLASVASVTYPAEIAVNHCRGYWWSIAEVMQLELSAGLILDRLDWLAPAQAGDADVIETAELHEQVRQRLIRDQSPILLAVMSKNGDVWQESCRGMVVPDTWLTNALQRRFQNRPDNQSS
ncbi:DUF1853 family protein [Undibacterium sp. RuTC16W]|uniref:DUF1853 family protein n=1 Tax=Undibacterium sp. RuTC16W TaxID=3413048 RepID=UPI003BF2ED03